MVWYMVQLGTIYDCQNMAVFGHIQLYTGISFHFSYLYFSHDIPLSLFLPSELFVTHLWLLASFFEVQ